MFKSIFSKLVFISVIILVTGFSVTGVMLNYFLGDFVLSEKVKVLERSADEINSFLNEYIDSMDNRLINASFRYLIRSYMINTNSYIWIVDKDGYIIATDQMNLEAAIPDVIKKNLKEEDGRLRLPDERQYRKVMLGQNPVNERGNFYGLFKDTGVPWQTIEKPFTYNGIILAAVYLHTPIPEIQKVRASVLRFFLMSVAISVLVSFILVYVFSLRISRPLKEINNAARVIAAGEFKNRLNIKSNDEIGELANSFNQMVIALQNLEEMRRGFIANVSHELRTPMTSIRGFIEGILDGTIPPDKHQMYLTIVKEETTRLSRLVNDLLDLARMEAGELTLTYRSFNINELIRRSIIKLESLIIQKNLEIEATFEQEELFVNADQDAIERVVINLMHNAIKFTPEGGKIILGTSRQRDKILVSVQDNGIGIDREEIDLIWDRFYKSDKSRSKDKTGTGLGLAIIKNIINEHKQEIWVESELGKGTKFTFTLARAKEAES